MFCHTHRQLTHTIILQGPRTKKHRNSQYKRCCGIVVVVVRCHLQRLLLLLLPTAAAAKLPRQLRDTTMETPNGRHWAVSPCTNNKPGMHYHQDHMKTVIQNKSVRALSSEPLFCRSRIEPPSSLTSLMFSYVRCSTLRSFFTATRIFFSRIIPNINSSYKERATFVVI